MDAIQEDTTWFMDLEKGNRILHEGRRFLSSYPEFNDPDALFNQEPPSSAVAFVIAGVLMIISIIMWWFRLEKLKARHLKSLGSPLGKWDLLRGMIGCAIDNDEPYFTIISFSATSFLFLGALQENFQTTFKLMIVFYFFSSLGDSARILLAYYQYENLSDVQLFSKMDQQLRDKRKEDAADAKKREEGKFETMEINPTNIYEDMGRERTIVIMLFLTQTLFITLVCMDVHSTPITKCLDGTSGCPVVGTMGSYGFYLVGIFQACVYLLGPKTGFGKSEQNPGYWLILLLASKGNGCKILWENPTKDPKLAAEHCTLKDNDGNVIKDEDGENKLYFCRTINPGDFRMWRRFFLSYLINGVGFHILVHALPIQVSMQSSILGVVFRAVGMLYLVDLDDSKGFTLIITEKGNAKAAEEDAEKDEKAGGEEGVKDEESSAAKRVDSTGAISHATPFDESVPLPGPDKELLKAEAKAIIEEAKKKLDDLYLGGPRKGRPGASNFRKSTNLMMHGVTTVGSLKISGDDKAKKNSGAAAALQGSTGDYAGGAAVTTVPSGGDDGGGGGQ